MVWYPCRPLHGLVHRHGMSVPIKLHYVLPTAGVLSTAPLFKHKNCSLENVLLVGWGRDVKRIPNKRPKSSLAPKPCRKPIDSVSISAASSLEIEIRGPGALQGPYMALQGRPLTTHPWGLPCVWPRQSAAAVGHPLPTPRPGAAPAAAAGYRAPWRPGLPPAPPRGPRSWAVEWRRRLGPTRRGAP